MERDSFVFYKSFYEAISDLPKDIRLEVLTAIIEYALYGRQPETLKPFARGMFTLIKPNIDTNNSRYDNGKRGGRPKKQPTPPDPSYNLTFEQEVDRMKSDDECRKSVCDQFGISSREYDTRLAHFLDRCNQDRSRKDKGRHESYADCQSHLRYWMSKAYPSKPENKSSAPSDFTYSGGFGGKDV